MSGSLLEGTDDEALDERPVRKFIVVKQRHVNPHMKLEGIADRA